MGVEKSHGFIMLTWRAAGEDIDVSRAMDVNVSTLLCVSLDHRKPLEIDEPGGTGGITKGCSRCWPNAWQQPPRYINLESRALIRPKRSNGVTMRNSPVVCMGNDGQAESFTRSQFV